MSILEKIRQMPDNQKKIFSLATATVLTLVVIVLWSSTTGSANSQMAEKKTDKLSSISPMQVIKDQFSKAFADVHTSINSLQDNSNNASSTQVVEEQTASTTVPIIINEAATSTASTTLFRSEATDGQANNI